VIKGDDIKSLSYKRRIWKLSFDVINNLLPQSSQNAHQHIDDSDILLIGQVDRTGRGSVLGEKASLIFEIKFYNRKAFRKI
jgi:hypothetical protein